MSRVHDRARRTASHPTPVTDAETHHALEALRTHTSGLTRADLVRLFGSDRRGRDVIAALVERRIAAVVVLPNPFAEREKVYRLARTIEEVEAEERRLHAYELSTRRRREGLRPAFERGPEAPQAPLF